MAEAYTRVDSTLTMSDGVVLSVAWFLPESTPPAEGWPGILSVHGFAGSKNSNAFLTQLYADSGYFAVTWSVRGQGREAPNLQSGGKFNWFTGDRELEDIREILDWMASRADVDAEHIGIEGTSQGGLMTWGSVIEQFPVRCAVIRAAVPHYSETHAHNGCNNYFTVNALALTKGTLVDMGPFIGDSIYNAYQNDNHQELLRLLESVELIDKVDRIRVPVYAQLPWQDDLFGSPSLFRAVRECDAPMKLLLVPGGHGGSRPAEVVDYGLAQTFRFWRRWLREDLSETIMSPDSLITFVNTADTSYVRLSAEQLDAWTPGEFGGTGTTYYLSVGNRLTTGRPTLEIDFSFFYVVNITDASVIYRTDPLREPLTIIGAETSFFAESSARTWQTNVLLWDRDPETGSARPITRGAWQVRDGGAKRRIEYQLSPQLYTIPAGHVVEAHFRFGLPLIKPESEFGKAPFAPQESAFTTISGSLVTPAYVRLLTPSDVSSVSGGRKVNRTTDGPRLSVPGNPFTRGETITVDLAGKGPESGATLQLTDMLGTLMAEQPANGGTVRFETTDLPSGVYTLSLRTGSAITDDLQIVVR